MGKDTRRDYLLRDAYVNKRIPQPIVIDIVQAIARVTDEEAVPGVAMVPRGGALFAGQIPFIHPIPGTGGATFTGLGPVIPTRVNIPAGALTFTGQAPTVPVRINVPIGLISFVGLAPELVVTDGATNVPTGAATFTGQGPTIPLIVNVPVGALTFTGEVPTIVTSAASGITLVGTVATNVTNDTPTDINLPAGTTTDDIVLVGLAADATLTSGGVTEPGYTNMFASGNVSPGSTFDRKVMGATPDTVVEITGATGRTTQITIMVWRGVDTTTPIDDNTPTFAGNTTGMPNPGSYTTSGANRVRIIWGAQDDDFVTDITAPSGWENLVEESGPSSGVASSSMMASLAAPTAGTVDPDAFGGSGSDPWDSLHFALRPA